MSSLGVDRKYLLMQRKHSEGGYWQGISGGVEDDEDIATAASRELSEETGFAPICMYRVEFLYTFPVSEEMISWYSSDVEMLTEYVFLAYIDGTPAPRLETREHCNWCWCSYEEAMELLYWRGNKESLKQCEYLINTELTRT